MFWGTLSADLRLRNLIVPHPGKATAQRPGCPEVPVVFSYDGNEVCGGFHITEVKAGHFSALDCGANPGAWSEIFVQLWDADEDNRAHMAARKFASSVRKVSEHVALDGSAKLTFEVSDGIAPMQLHKASSPVLERASFMSISGRGRRAVSRMTDGWLKV